MASPRKRISRELMQHWEFAVMHVFLIYCMPQPKLLDQCLRKKKLKVIPYKFNVVCQAYYVVKEITSTRKKVMLLLKNTVPGNTIHLIFQLHELYFQLVRCHIGSMIELKFCFIIRVNNYFKQSISGVCVIIL